MYTKNKFLVTILMIIGIFFITNNFDVVRGNPNNGNDDGVVIIQGEGDVPPIEVDGGLIAP